MIPGHDEDVVQEREWGIPWTSPNLTLRGLENENPDGKLTTIQESSNDKSTDNDNIDSNGLDPEEDYEASEPPDEDTEIEDPMEIEVSNIMISDALNLAKKEDDTDLLL